MIKNTVPWWWSVSLILLALVGMNCMAETHYVVTNGTPGHTGPVDPYATWATAGTNIIEVVNAAMTNTVPRIVWVTNGIYYPTNEIVVTNALTLQSVNGRAATILHGGSAGTNRCIYLVGIGYSEPAVFNGFTVTNYSPANMNGTVNGRYSQIINCLITSNRLVDGGVGGGIYCTYTTITNCIVRGNVAWESGGGILSGYNNTILDSVIEDNTAERWYGGGIQHSLWDVVISNCWIINNKILNVRSDIESIGAGLLVGDVRGSVNISSCVITGNVIDKVNTSLGGGVCAVVGNFRNCTIAGNSAPNIGGGFWGRNVTLRNCLIAGNSVNTNGGGIFVTTNSTIESCTIVSNYAGVSGGGLYASGLDVTGTNNVIYHNTAVSAANFTNTTGNTGLNYCCVIPAVDGTHNITNDPMFVGKDTGNYRLRISSPCVNTGTNQDWMTNAVDLGGSARIQNIIVDMGAYETLLWQGTIYKVY